MLVVCYRSADALLMERIQESGPQAQLDKVQDTADLHQWCQVLSVEDEEIEGDDLVEIWVYQRHCLFAGYPCLEEIVHRLVCCGLNEDVAVRSYGDLVDFLHRGSHRGTVMVVDAPVETENIGRVRMMEVGEDN